MTVKRGLDTLTKTRKPSVMPSGKWVIKAMAYGVLGPLHRDGILRFHPDETAHQIIWSEFAGGEALKVRQLPGYRARMLE
jgi:hypothetical protein